MIDPDAKIFTGRDLIYKAVEINRDNINREMVLSYLNTILILLQVNIVKFGISDLDIIMSFI